MNNPGMFLGPRVAALSQDQKTCRRRRHSGRTFRLVALGAIWLAGFQLVAGQSSSDPTPVVGAAAIGPRSVLAEEGATRQAHAAFPRRNGKIVFTSDRDGNLEIYLMDADGTNQMRLTNNPGIDSHPSWSPDGTRIGFVSESPSGAFFLSLMNADGTNRTPITPLAFPGSPWPWHEEWSMSWSPDGATIAFEDQDDILIVNIDGSGRVNLTNSPSEYDNEPAWSPDGSKILFVSSRVSWRIMHTVRPDGSDLQPLPSDDEYWDSSPDWAPAGDRIAFVVHSETFLPVIYTADADGTHRQIFDGSGFGSTHRNKPKWSLDANAIAFHMWDFGNGDCQVYVKGVFDSGFAQLTNSPGRNFHPSWQPRCKRTGTHPCPASFP